MKATINPRQSDRIASHRKEDSLYSQVSIVDRDTGKEIVICRVYWPGTVAYACVWIHGTDIHARGAGKAGGGGYCKESAAISAALSDAGVTLDEGVSGRGGNVAAEALHAVARAVTFKRKFYEVRAHG